MAQISKGETFADSQQLTATRLNQLVDSAQILVGVISDQTSITANTLEATDTTLINDAGTLKKATVGDFLNSGLAVTTSVVNTKANTDLIVTPYDATAVVGSNYTSGDGLTVTVTTLAAHGLAVNNVVLISGAGTGYNGTFKITAVTSLTFTYVMYVAATPTGSPTACTYVRKATEIVNGNVVASGNVYAENEIDTLNLQVDGQALVNSSTTKTANVTTAMQYSGVPVWGLVSITETTVPFAQCDATTEPQRVATCNQWRDVLSITGQTKTNKEIWVVEVDAPVVAYQLFSSRFRILLNGTSSSLAMQTSVLQGGTLFNQYQVTLRAVIPEGTTFTSDAIKFQFRYDASSANASAILNVGYGGSMTFAEITRVVRITKYAKP
jgi:hypothetical protein